jgi:hypothetical protein
MEGQSCMCSLGRGAENWISKYAYLPDPNCWTLIANLRNFLCLFQNSYEGMRHYEDHNQAI